MKSSPPFETVDELREWSEYRQRASSGSLGEKAQVEELRLRSSAREGGSLVDLLTDEELWEARQRRTSIEKTIASMFRPWLLVMESAEQAQRQAQKQAIRDAKSRGGRTKDPSRTAVIKKITRCLATSDELNTARQIWRFMRSRPRRTPEGFTIQPDGSRLSIQAPDGRKRVITESTFRRYAAEAKGLLRPTAQ